MNLLDILDLDLIDLDMDATDKDGVLKTKFYMPGVAYNMIFYFEEVNDGEYRDQNRRA